MKRLIYILIILFNTALSFAQADINKAEYFIDSDPGVNNGTAIAITPGKIIDQSFNADLTGLANGLHFLYVRTHNDSGWSMSFVHPFIIELSAQTETAAALTKLEYFLDTDPGFGNATPLSLNNPVEILNQPIDLTGVTTGFHMIYFRVKDVNSLWSHTFVRPVILIQTAQPNIMQAEYFFDADPGLGNANPIAMTVGQAIDINFSASMNGLTPGFHFLTVRIKDIYGNWSTNYHRAVFVSGGNNIPNLVSFEYQIDSFAGIGTGTTIPLNGAPIIDSILTVDLTGITAGMHELFFTVKDENEMNSPIQKLSFCVASQAKFLSDSLVCYGSDVNFTNVSEDTLPTTTFWWDINNDGVVDFTTANNFTFSYSTPGTYTSTLIVDKDSVCADTMSANIIVAPYYATASFSVDTVCFGDYSTITDNTFGATSATVYEWDIDNDGITDTTLTNSFIYTYSSAGKTIITLNVYDDPNCVSSYTDSTYIDPNAVTAMYTVDSACIGYPNSFVDLSTGTTSTTTYNWDFDGNGTIDNSTAGDIQNTYTNVGSYNSQLILNNNTVCADTFNLLVLVDSIGTISGTISNNSGPISAGYVKLFKYKTSGVLPLIDSVPITTMGQYQFTDLNPDNYIIKAFADTNIYPNTAPTYLDSTTNWKNANIVYSLCDTIINFNMLDLSLVSGSGTISGYLYNIDTIRRAGDPIPGIDIALEQIPGGIIVKNTETNDKGYYEFNNLPDYTYQIYVDIPGAPMDSTYTITINSTDNTYQNLNFTFDSVSIYIDQSTGIHQLSSTNGYVIDVYPNPFNNKLNISMELDHDQHQINIEVYDIIGNLVIQLSDINQAGSSYYKSLNFNEDQFNAGFYFMKIQVNNQPVELIKVVRTQ